MPADLLSTVAAGSVVQNSRTPENGGEKLSALGASAYATMCQPRIAPCLLNMCYLCSTPRQRNNDKNGPGNEELPGNRVYFYLLSNKNSTCIKLASTYLTNVSRF